MSRSEITCRKCGKPVAVRHHRGRLRIVEDVKAEIAEDGVWVTCPECGAVRLLRLPERREDERRAA